MTISSAKGHIESGSPHWIEWLSGILSALLVAGLAGWLCWDVYRYDDRPPDFILSVTAVMQREGGYSLSFDIHNTSMTTAATVHVVGVLTGAGADETASVTFDYVASESHDNGVLFFSRDPRNADLALRVEGYTEP